MNELIISNLSKTYANGVKALDDISLTISTGMFGLLGPNGAGKSTLMRTIATLQEADEGSVTLGDLDVLRQKEKVRRQLGYLPQAFGLYPKMSAIALLDHLAILKGVSQRKERKDLVEQLLHKTNLYQNRKQKLGTFSGGMKQRFGIAQALLASPKLLIVDEPTAGLDPAERNRFHNLLSEVAEDAIIILSTHIVEDIVELCPQMAIIKQGKVVLSGQPQQLISEISGKVYAKTVRRSDANLYHKHYRVIAEKLLRGQPVLHIYSDTPPGNGFEAVSADLGSVYFTELSRKN